MSLVPAATEIVWALGASDQLVAVTHDDDFPATVLTLPRITRSTIPPGATAREIDAHVRDAGARDVREWAVPLSCMAWAEVLPQRSNCSSLMATARPRIAMLGGRVSP